MKLATRVVPKARASSATKTACHRWEANQFRLLLHRGAYWLLHALRRAMPRRSIWRGATFETIRRTFVKIAVRVEEMKNRIKLAFPASYPQAAALLEVGAAVAAGVGRRNRRRERQTCRDPRGAHGLPDR